MTTPEKMFNLGSLQPYSEMTRLEKLARDKHSSLLQKFINYGEKGFITLGSGGANIMKLFSAEFTNFYAELECFPGWAAKLARDQHSSLFGPF
jgi:hypothetical protein